MTQQERASLSAAGIRWAHVGTVSDAELVALYSFATALVALPAYEGFGLPILEAMACGTCRAYKRTSRPALTPQLVTPRLPCCML